jgi:hypothetical protein
MRRRRIKIYFYTFLCGAACAAEPLSGLRLKTTGLRRCLRGSRRKPSCVYKMNRRFIEFSRARVFFIYKYRSSPPPLYLPHHHLWWWWAPSSLRRQSSSGAYCTFHYSTSGATLAYILSEACAGYIYI